MSVRHDVDLVLQELALRGGEQTRMYCPQEGKITSFISITCRDLSDVLEKEAQRQNRDFTEFWHQVMGFIQDVPIYGGLMQVCNRVFNGRPYLCESCGKAKTQF